MYFPSTMCRLESETEACKNNTNVLYYERISLLLRR